MVLEFGLIKSGLFVESETTGEGIGSDTAQTLINTAASGNAGEGHVTLEVMAYNSITQGTWLWQINNNAENNGRIYNSTHADGDEIVYSMFLDAGTYTLIVIYASGPNGGIIDFYVDNVVVKSVDTWTGAATQNNRSVTTSIVISDAGLKTLKFKVNGKNAASGNHYVMLQAFCFFRTV